MAQTDLTKNERLALMLGYYTGAGVWLNPDHTLHGGLPPDYDQWSRFPELQAYVRGLEQNQQWEVVIRADREMSKNAAYSILGVTPAILGSALLEVCDA